MTVQWGTSRRTSLDSLAVRDQAGSGSGAGQGVAFGCTAGTEHAGGATTGRLGGEVVRPFARRYRVEPGGFLAGCYPGDPGRDGHLRKLRRLCDVGVNCIVNLMEANEVGHGGRRFAPDEDGFQWSSAEAGRQGQRLRLPIRDQKAPAAPTMVDILDAVGGVLLGGLHR